MVLVALVLVTLLINIINKMQVLHFLKMNSQALLKSNKSEHNFIKKITNFVLSHLFSRNLFPFMN